MDSEVVERLLAEGHEWTPFPVRGFDTAEFEGTTYGLPKLETVKDDQAVNLVLVRQEATWPQQFVSLRELGTLIERSPSDPRKFVVYPVFVPTALVPRKQRGQLAVLTSRAFQNEPARNGAVLRTPSKPNSMAVLNADHWWFEAAGAALENAIYSVYTAAYPREVA